LHLPEPVLRAHARRRPIQEIIIDTRFSDLGLLAELLSAVEAQGYTQPTPIQQQAIPPVLAGRDLLAAAQTGTGKTAGFVLPLLQRLKQSSAKGSPDGRRPPRVLILTPTRELAAQVEESVRIYGAHMPFKSTVVFGGVGIQPQMQALRRGVEILVATPGRLLDHVQQKTVDLSRIEILVLDEADRMLDMGFIRDIRRILALLPKQRQNLLFSATFSPEIRELAHSFLTDPAVVEVARRNAPSDLVQQVAHPVDQARKRELLAHLISQGDWRQVLVFTRTKHGANRLAQQLDRDGIAAEAIHGNKSQSHRTRTLADFKRGELRVLVATDIAARGLDIEELPHVVNFDLPHVPEDYVHRIGRTGRAGAEGEAVSLISAEDKPLLAAIEKLLGRSIERRVVAGFEPQQSQSVAEVEPRGRQQPQRSGAQQPQRRAAQQPSSRGHGQQSSQRGAGRSAEKQGKAEGARRQASGGAGGQGAQAGARPPRSGSAAGRSSKPSSPRSGSPAAGNSSNQPASRAAPKPRKQGTFASLLAGARRLIG
jgi:ATP-dependent RNA helicase RhlE